MKKVLLVGKLNSFMHEINSYLAEQCIVQLCPDDSEDLVGMLNIAKPDLVIVLMTGNAMGPKTVLTLLCEKCPGIPVMLLGSAEEEEAAAGYLSLEWVRFLRRPVSRDKLLRNLDRLLVIGQNLGESIQRTIEKTIAKNEELTSGMKRKTVLVVDDDSAVLRTMQEILSYRYKAMLTTSAAQAIASIVRRRPDIILLDYDMPVCDGRQTIQMLRAEQATKDIPVVFLVDASDPARIKTVMELKPQGYLLKPCSEDMLFHMIDTVLGE
ncbi:MAG: response regulator [Muribaculaceae bacterium]|nr:response regulator [Roseburia sp.]MCM1430969.1 response regulator [Muribaculaceae bacterium]MCM1494100.1 response regulator [Muribaculaceae bacterium]